MLELLDQWVCRFVLMIQLQEIRAEHLLEQWQHYHIVWM
jgi:hypothetical protein